MIDLNDYTYSLVMYHDKQRKNKLYKAYCDKCSADKGYKPKNYSNKLCNRCAGANKGPQVRNETLDADTNMIKKSIDGRICYKDNCITCKKDRGFVKKYDISKECKSCSNRRKKIGKISPKKGISTGVAAWNRGEYFYNNEKKRLRNRMSSRMRHALNGRNLSKNWQHIFDMLGYSIEDLKRHLELKFKDGMSWNNIGKWHIDHIVPESWFNYSSIDSKGFKECWALDNLQPLWAKDNLSKGARYADCCK